MATTVGELIRNNLINKKKTLTNEKCTITVEFVTFSEDDEVYKVKDLEKGKTEYISDFSKVMSVLLK